MIVNGMGWNCCRQVALAGELQWTLHQKAVTAVVGYDCMLRHCRLRGNVDSSGVVSQYLEREFYPFTKLVLSAQLDHWNKNWRFGFGFDVAGQ
jgi:mitochondrial import receptor subunit TOM40